MTTRNREGGFAVVVVLLVTVVVLLVVAVLFSAGGTRNGAPSEKDRLETLKFAEKGLALAKERIHTAGRCGGELVDGPSAATPRDDETLGLGDLRLASTIRFTSANESTTSAIVTRDFGDGDKKYEVLRMPGGRSIRALVYIRVDQDLDADLAPVPERSSSDLDDTIVATSIAEYPILVNHNGVEAPEGIGDGARARRMLRATFRLQGCGDPSPLDLAEGGTVRWWEIP